MTNPTQVLWLLEAPWASGVLELHLGADTSLQFLFFCHFWGGWSQNADDGTAIPWLLCAGSRQDSARAGSAENTPSFQLRNAVQIKPHIIFSSCPIQWLRLEKQFAVGKNSRYQTAATLQPPVPKSHKNYLGNCCFTPLRAMMARK